MVHPQRGMDGLVKILVMGATGRIGRALRQIWAHRPDVLWQGRSQTTARPCWFVWTPGDALPKAGSVLVLSGVTQGTPEALGANTQIALDIQAAAEAAGIDRLLLASTMAVYGETPPEGSTEQTPPRPLRPYGRAKLEMERAALARQDRTRVCALRIGNMIGAGPLWTAMAQAEAGSIDAVTLDRFADGQGPLRSHVGPSLLARTVDTLSGPGHDLPEVLNVALRRPIAMADIVAAAGLTPHWAPAPLGAIQTATMQVGPLDRLGVLDDMPDSAQDVVSEWRALRKIMQ